MAYKQVDDGQDSLLNRFGTGLKRTLVGGATKFLEGIQNQVSPSPEQIEEYLGSQSWAQGKNKMATPRDIQLKNQVRNLLGLSEQDIQPQGTLENFGQHGFSTALGLLSGGLVGPSVLKGGVGNAAQSIKRALPGVAVKTGLEEVGAPDWLQTAGQLATDIKLGTRRNQKKVAGVEPKTGLTLHKENMYAKAKAALKNNESGEFKPLNDAFKYTQNIYKTETDKKVKDIVRNIEESVLNNVTQRPLVRKNATDLIDIGNAWELKKSLYTQRKTAPEGAHKYIDKFTDGINKVLEAHSPANPTFWKNLKGADEIHAFENMNSFFGDYIKKLESKASWKKAIDPLYLGKKGIASVLKGAESLNNIKNTPVVRKYYGNMITSALKNNPADVVRYGQQFKKAIASQKNKEPERNNGWKMESEAPKSGWKMAAE